MAYDIKLKLFIDDEWVDKSEYIQLPITITETMDETLDRAEVILTFTPDNSEYEAYTDAELTLENDKGFSKTHSMIVQKDRMEEKFIGLDSVYYKHTVTFIETTERLKSFIVNDFSVTQPVSVGNPDVIPPSSNLEIIVNKPAVSPSTNREGFWNNIGEDFDNVFLLRQYGLTNEDDKNDFINTNFQQTGDDAFRTNGMGLIHRKTITTEEDGTFEAAYFASGAYNFNIANLNYGIRNEYTVEPGFINIPKANGTFMLRTSLVTLYDARFLNVTPPHIKIDDINEDMEFNNLELPLNFKEKVYDVTNPSNIVDVTSTVMTTVGNTNKIDKSKLVIDRKYRYTIRTAQESVDGDG
jgi:hypothetical protein